MAGAAVECDAGEGGMRGAQKLRGGEVGDEVGAEGCGEVRWKGG